jgi:hypothetical protein
MGESSFAKVNLPDAVFVEKAISFLPHHPPSENLES